MNRKIKWVCYGLAALMFSALAGNTAMASIVGDTVEIQYLYPNSTTQYGSSVTGVVTASGVSMTIFNNQKLTVYGTDVQMVALQDSIFSSGSGITFNGFGIQDLTNPSAFTTFSVDPASTLAGFSISDVSVSGGTLFINFEGLLTPYGSLAQVDFTSAAPVPEPSSMMLTLFGLALIGLLGACGLIPINSRVSSVSKSS